MLIGVREERRPRRKFKEKRRDRVKETEMSGQRGAVSVGKASESFS